MLIDHSISSRPPAFGRGAADQLEREVRLTVADALGRPGADDVRDRLDHVLEVLALGLVVGREVKLIQRVLAAAAPTHPARRPARSISAPISSTPTALSIPTRSSSASDPPLVDEAVRRACATAAVREARTRCTRSRAESLDAAVGCDAPAPVSG